MYKFLCGHMFSFLLGIYLGVELLVHMVTLCLTFGGIPNYFPKWLYHFTFPPIVYECSNFSTSSPTLVIICFFYYSPPSEYEIVSHCSFDLDFLDE